MAGNPSVAVLRDIQTLFDVGTAAGLTDRQLLGRFADRRDDRSDAAFEVLVLRHGPMVLRVCRNQLREKADVADAFQATFLVLVGQRETLRSLESVAGWLYGVACRVAARARVDAARRLRAEKRAALRVVEAVDPADDKAMTKDFGPVVQEEVRRLPLKYRAVVVLCYWQSLTHEQAAAQLGCPLGTVRSRLARARKLLHRRLTRRGLAPLAGVVAAALDESTASASALSAVPPALVNTTIRAAAAAASGRALSYIGSGATASLVDRVLWSMTMMNIKTAAGSLALVGLVAYGAAIGAQYVQTTRPQQSVVSNQSPLTADSASDEKRGSPEARTQERLDKSDFISEVQIPTTIRKIVRDGSSVTKGQLICELDTSVFWDLFINQQITVESAKANHQNKVLVREWAEADARAYKNDLLPREQREDQAEVTVAKAELSLAQEQLNATKAVGGNNKLELMRADLAIAHARLAIEKAENRLHTLLAYTSSKQTREFASAVERARSDELAKKALVAVELGKLRKLEKQVAACKIIAPIDGFVVYFPPAVAGGSAIEEGAIVQPRHRLFRIVPRSDTQPRKP